MTGSVMLPLTSSSLFRRLLICISLSFLWNYNDCSSTRLGGAGVVDSGSGSKRNHHHSPTTTTQRQLYYFNNIDLSQVSLCGCNSCYDKGVSGYSTRLGEESCAVRIMRLIVQERYPEEAACRKVASVEFADQCGTICNPLLCDGRSSNGQQGGETPQQVLPSDTTAIEAQGGGSPTAAQQQQQASSSSQTTPSSLSTTPAVVVVEKTFCGCQSCTTDAWVTMAGPFSCGARISFLTDFRHHTLVEACRRVASIEYADACGDCNPDTCEKVDPANETPPQPGGDLLDTSPTTTSEGEGGDLLPPPPPPPQQQSSAPEFDDIPLTPEFELYCFPPPGERERYENVWGKYIVEAKESSNRPCGPSDNFFSRRTVQMHNDNLILQYRKMGNRWAASEVRVLLPPDEMPFHYGQYSFSVKSVQVIDITSGIIVDTKLPPSLILGLFTWDATEDYSQHENYNHEVDVEISRWNIDDLADVQYLVQPPGDPHKYRFFSGEEGDKSYRQAPHTYNFEWKPAEIDWTSSAGGGDHNFTYGTQHALDAGQPDYVQCMPADVEIRMNLWNLFGSRSTPRDMRDSFIVQVVIDNFQFTPSGSTGLPEGGTCSKDCQCNGPLVCRVNRCESLTFEDEVGPTLEDGAKPLPPGMQGLDELDIPATVAAATSEATNEESGGGGMGRAGKALLTIFFLLLTAVIGAGFFLRYQRNKKNVTRMAKFTNKGNQSQIITYNSSNPMKKIMLNCWESTHKKLMVECWESAQESGCTNNGIEQTPTFEMELQDNKATVY